MAKTNPITDPLRRAVEQAKKAGRTAEQIAESAGIDPATLSRFMAGKTMLLDRADALAHHLGLSLMPREPRK